MTVGELKVELSNYPDDMRVLCWDSETYDAPQVVPGVLRGETEYLHVGTGAREDAEDANEVDVEDGGEAQPLADVCVVKPDNV